MKNKYPSRYIDKEDVERGYYVYAHLCKRTKHVFYVGKGHTGRAWSRNRPDSWHEYVETLPEGYEVMLLHEDLTEAESFQLEKEEIANNGGAAAVGGSLLNWLPESTMDGDIGPAAVIEIQWEPNDEQKQQMAAYDAVRAFRELSPQERKVAADRISDLALSSYSPIAKLYGGYLDRDEECPACVSTAGDINAELFTLAHRLAKKKMRYRQFCEEAEYQVESLQWNYRDIEAGDQYRQLLADNLEAVKKWFGQFEIPGNREAAERAREEVATHQFQAKYGFERTSEEGRRLIERQIKEAREKFR